MQAVVKMPHIEISVRGSEIPPKLIKVLKEEYGRDLDLVMDEDDEFVDVSETKWYKDIKDKMNPGKYLRIHREKKGLTQVELGEILGGIPRQNISNMENGCRAISLKMARRLSSILDAPIERFLEKTE